MTEVERALEKIRDIDTVEKQINVDDIVEKMEGRVYIPSLHMLGRILVDVNDSRVYRELI